MTDGLEEGLYKGGVLRAAPHDSDGSLFDLECEELEQEAEHDPLLISELKYFFKEGLLECAGVFLAGLSLGSSSTDFLISTRLALF